MHSLEAQAITVPSSEPGRKAPLPDPVALRIEAGEVVGLRGPSGCGKTTLLRCLSGLEPRATGHIKVDGQPIAPAHWPDYRARICYLPQRPPRFAMTVAEAFAYAAGLRVHRAQGSYRCEELEASMAELGLDPGLQDANLPELSGGELQRISLLRTLLGRPEVLLLDEPSSALDPDARARMASYLRRWMQAEGRAIVLVQHERDALSELCTREIDLNAEAKAH